MTGLKHFRRISGSTRHLGNRKVLREGLLNKSTSGRKLRAFLCNDILILTDEHAKIYWSMADSTVGDSHERSPRPPRCMS
ncbi:hypothetical protein BGW80DRAFT_1340328 [Lactifluus volemus]|nr:hypothetical protein BGW80DRAFT_1340328 [Lactifluus volemus]